MNPEDTFSLVSSDLIKIVFAGGLGRYIGLLYEVIPLTTKKVELPANWDKFAGKYKDMVPTLC